MDVQELGRRRRLATASAPLLPALFGLPVARYLRSVAHRFDLATPVHGVRAGHDPVEESLVSVVLEPLPYAYDALAPVIDAETMKIHHDLHHAAYTSNFNAALEQHPDLATKSVESMLSDLDSVPEAVRTAVRNHGGGFLNHTFFWESMAPNSSGKPSGDLADAIDAVFGELDTFKAQFNDAGLKRFGSGWSWLVLDHSGRLEVVSTANQDSPLTNGQIPLLVNDVWEHAYYLTYHNRRAEYLTAWWKVVNWAKVEQRFAVARAA